jgi:pimeloyl-ACP methyl ester carboxylesterase
LSWWSCRDVVRGLQGRYFVVTPILDGHGEDCDTEFVSIEDSAQKLIRRIDERYGGRIFALCGLSLGAQITAEALAQRSDLAEYAVIESALVFPLGFARLSESAINLTYGLIKKRWFAKLQAKSLALPEELFEEYFEDSKKITLPSLLNVTRSNAAYTAKPTLRKTTAKVLVAAGLEEPSVMRKSAELLHEALPGSQLYLLPGLRHGELSVGHGGDYAELLIRFFSGAPFRVKKNKN